MLRSHAARLRFAALALFGGGLAPLPAHTAAAQVAPAPGAPALVIEEATIAQVHAAFASGTLTCRQLVQHYLDRIAAYDKQGPAINALILTHPRALVIADSLDGVYAAHHSAQRARDRTRTRGSTSEPNSPHTMGALHCVPVIVKDNFETRDLQTTAGSLALEGWVPTRDATMVARLRAAGAIVLAKSNLAEWAFTPYETVSSILPGYTKNPYALDRVTAGSSGGTAAAVAASFGLVGLGTDTGNSIRGPSAHQALVGMRSTMGLTSRAGVVPLILGNDIAGPMTRTVADAAAVFQVVAGYDPNDPVTDAARTQRAVSYRDSLKADGLRGARIGVLTQAYARPTLDADVNTVFTQAVSDLRAAGATVIDSVLVPDFDRIMRSGGACNSFPFDLARYFAARGEGASVRSVRDVLQSGKYHPTVQGRLQAADTITLAPENTPGCAQREAMRAELRTAVQRLMDSLTLDAVVYPTWSNVPRLIGDLNTPHGDNSQVFSPLTGFPAITVPMGYTRNGMLPAGLSILGRPWSEGTLFRLAYAYEQHTTHRKAPLSTPRLPRTVTLTPQADSVLRAMGASPIMQNPTFPAPRDAVYRIAWDVNVGPASPDKVVDGFRRPANFFRLADVNGVPRGNVHLALIVYGTAARSLLTNDAYKAATGVDNASAPLLEALHASGVQIIVCGEALISRNIPRDQLLPFVQVATTATMARAILHTQGYATFQP